MGMTYITCGCLPGSYDEGWREIRCKECVAAESAQWSRMMEWMRSPAFDATIERIRNGRPAD